MAPPKDRTLRWWERLLLIGLGISLFRPNSEPEWIAAVLSIAGAIIVLSASGFVELLMAAFYRYKAVKRANRKTSNSR